MKKIMAILLVLPVLARSGPLTWKQAVDETLVNNPSLASARLQVSAAQSGVTQSSANFWPSVNASAGINRSGYGPQNGGPESDSSSYQTGLSGSWNLFNGFSTVYGRLAAMETLAQRKAQYTQTSSSVLLSLRQAFNQIFFDQENALLLDAIAKRYQQDTRYQQLQFQSGRAARWTFLKAQSDEAEVKWEVEQNTLSLQADQASLASVLDRAQDQAGSLKVLGNLEAAEPPEDTKADWVKISKNHPSILLSKAQIAMSEDGLGQARASLYPDLNAQGNYGYSGADAWGPTQHSWGASLNLSFNLFAGGANMAGINQADETLEASRKNLTSTLSQVESSLYKAWASYFSAYRRLPVARMATAAGIERFKTVKTLYQSGRAAFLDYEQAESIYTSSQQQELSISLSAAQAAAQYQSALGVSLEDVKTKP